MKLLSFHSSDKLAHFPSEESYDFPSKKFLGPSTNSESMTFCDTPIFNSSGKTTFFMYKYP